MCGIRQRDLAGLHDLDVQQLELEQRTFTTRELDARRAIMWRVLFSGFSSPVVFAEGDTGLVTSENGDDVGGSSA